MQDVGQNGFDAGDAGGHDGSGAARTLRYLGANEPASALTLLQMTWLPPHVGHTLPSSSAIEALTLLQSGKTNGKVLLEVICE